MRPVAAPLGLRFGIDLAVEAAWVGRLLGGPKADEGPRVTLISTGVRAYCELSIRRLWYRH